MRRRAENDTGTHHGAGGADGAVRPSLLAVARRAGVSPATVSKALNDAPGISGATRARVRAAAVALGYTPSLAAQSMRNRRSRTIGILTERPLAYQWVGETVSGILDVTAEAGMASVVLLTDRSPERTKESVAELRRREVEGFVFVGAGSPPSIRPWLAGWDVPHVYTFCQPQNLDAAAVLMDDAQGAAMAVQHLVEMGRRRFVLLSGPPTSGTALVRAAAARVALAAAGLPVDAAHERSGPWDEAFGWQTTTELIAHDPTIDAVVAANDFIAFGAVQALLQLGRCVPEEIAVVGFDNHVVSTMVRPHLTTMAVPTYECGRHAGHYVLERAAARRGVVGSTGGVPDAGAGIGPPQHVVRLPCTLVIRESSVGSGPPASRPAGQLVSGRAVG